jgi:hypothetical protein
MLTMKAKIIIFCFLMFFIALGLFAWQKEFINKSYLVVKEKKGYKKSHIDSLRKFAKINNYNTHYGFFLNLKMHSGSNRLFLVSLDSQKTILSSLCCHGRGQFGFSENPPLSNVIGSNCSSDGIYKIGYKYDGAFGTAYKLYGLSKSNSNAFKRYVVFHAHDCVPEAPVATSICQSEGCPTVSPNMLLKYSSYIDNSQKPILLWVYKEDCGNL